MLCSGGISPTCDHGTTSRARSCTARTVHLAHFALQRETDVWCLRIRRSAWTQFCATSQTRSTSTHHPEDVSLDAIHNGSVSHRGLETRPSAKAEPSKAGNIEAVPPDAIQLLGERPADLVTTGGDQIDAVLWVEAVLGEDSCAVLDQHGVWNSAREMGLENVRIPSRKGNRIRNEPMGWKTACVLPAKPNESKGPYRESASAVSSPSWSS